MTVSLTRMPSIPAYFTFLPAHLGLRSLNEASKLNVSVFSRSALTDTWVKLSRRATTVVDWVWYSTHTTADLAVSRNLTLDFPTRTTRYTLSRGPMVRKKRSREQLQASAKKCGLWLSFSLPAFHVFLAQPVAWYWTLRDLIFFSRSVGAFSALDSVALGISRLSAVNAIPAAGFICVT